MSAPKPRRQRQPRAAKTVAPRAETEAQFQAAVITLARYAGWDTYHTYDSRRSEPGFPDLVLAKGGRLIFAEIKTARGRLSLAQRRWLTLLSNTPGVEVALWRPADFHQVKGALADGESLPPLDVTAL